MTAEQVALEIVKSLIAGANRVSTIDYVELSEMTERAWKIATEDWARHKKAHLSTLGGDA
jgi:hypothetical protein